MTRWCTVRARSSARMPGDAWQQFANLRAYYAFMWGHPGKKLLFMGQEFAQGVRVERRSRSLDWHLLDVDQAPQACSRLVRDLEPTLPGRAGACIELDCARGTASTWLEANDAENVRCWPGLEKAATTRRADPCDLQLHARPPAKAYRLGPASPRPVARDLEFSDAADLRRLGHGQSRHDRDRSRLAAMIDHARPSVTLPPLATLWFRWEPAD